MISALEAVELTRQATVTFKPELVKTLLAEIDNGLKKAAGQGFGTFYVRVACLNGLTPYSQRDVQAALAEVIRVLRERGYDVTSDDDQFPYSCDFRSQKFTVSWERLLQNAKVPYNLPNQ